uniref:Uncharacterized protein n=1 Tax=Clytia hemisphaerica TaxID=252671 RepID=A0A7M5V1V7_9CNID
MKYYRHDVRIPIFKTYPNESYSPQSLVDLLVSRKTRRIATKKPTKVQGNLSFIIDSTKLKNKNDWSADDLGSWENQGNSGTIVTVDENNQVLDSWRMNRKTKDRQKIQPGQYLFYKTYFRSRSSSDFRRTSLVVKTHDNKTLDLVMVEYRFEGEVHPIVVKSHGLAKKNKQGFIPTAASTKNKIKDAVSGTVRGPNRIFDDIFEMSMKNEQLCFFE